MESKKSLSLIVGILCVAITLFGIFSATNNSFFKLPIFKLTISESEMDRITDSIDVAIEKIDDLSDEDLDELEEADISVKEYEKFLKKPSLNKMIKIGDKIDTIDIGDSVDVLSLFRTVIIVWGVIVALFSLLGALLKKKVFPIIAIILSILFYILFAGILLFILFIIASIAHIVLLSKEKQAQ